MYTILTLFVAVSLAAGNVLPAHRHPESRKPAVRVIGGHEAPITNFPFQVSIQTSGIHTCGGSIINENTILTSGYCIDSSLPPAIYEVVAGATVLDDDNAVRINASKTIVHEKFVGYDYDIAIVKLSQNLILSDSISPVKLPESEGLPDGTIVNVSGYGIIYGGDISEPGKLYAAEVALINQDICLNDYVELIEPLTERMICAGVPEGGIDACFGDRGGPLSHNGTLIGIMSWQYGCGLSRYPTVYTSVSSLLSWINEHIEE